MEQRPWTITEERERAAYVLGVVPTAPLAAAQRRYRELLTRHAGASERDRAARQALRSAWAVWRRTTPPPDPEPRGTPSHEGVVAAGATESAVEVLEISRDQPPPGGGLTVALDDLAVVVDDERGGAGASGRDARSRPAERGGLRDTATAWRAYTLLGDVEQSTTDVRL